MGIIIRNIKLNEDEDEISITGSRESVFELLDMLFAATRLMNDELVEQCPNCCSDPIHEDCFCETCGGDQIRELAINDYRQFILNQKRDNESNG